MSYAILELELRQPPGSVERRQTSAGDDWRIRCEACAGHSRWHRLLSSARAEFSRHGDKHIQQDADDLTELLDTSRNPLEVKAVA